MKEWNFAIIEAHKIHELKNACVAQITQFGIRKASPESNCYGGVLFFDELSTSKSSKNISWEWST